MLQMKKIFSGALAVTLLSTTPLMAKSKHKFFSIGDDFLYEKLKEKGILTESDVKEIEKEKKAAAKIHSLNIGTRLQFRYEYRDQDNGHDDVNEMNIRRMRIEFKGNMWKDISYKFEVAMDKMKDLHMKDASVTFKQLGHFAHIRVGQFKTPFSRQRTTSSSKLSVIDRSIIEKLYPGRDTGIELSGKNILGMFDYAVAMETGWGDKRKFIKVDNNEFWYDGRLVFHPLGKVAMHEGDLNNSEKPLFELGLNGLYAPNQVATGERSVNDMFLANKAFGTSKKVNNLTSSELDDMYGDITVWGPDATFFFNGFSLIGEYYMAKYNPNGVGTNPALRELKTKGYFVQAGYLIIPKTLEVVGRYSYLDRDTSSKTSSDLKTYYAGINYYASHDHRFKLQAGYLWRDEMKDDFSNNSLILNAQIKF